VIEHSAARVGVAKVILEIQHENGAHAIIVEALAEPECGRFSWGMRG
jgi:hypothetical protein